MTRSFGIALLAVGACASEPVPAPPSASAPPVSAPPVSPATQLHELDGRAALPLLPQMAQHQKENMRDHLLAVQQIVSALASDDFDAVERAGSRLGLSDAMVQTCSHMGAAAPGFTEQATAFHQTADGISAAARGRDRTAVLSSLGATLTACNGCHATWKQELVDEATLAERTR